MVKKCTPADKILATPMIIVAFAEDSIDVYGDCDWLCAVVNSNEKQERTQPIGH